MVSKESLYQAIDTIRSIDGKIEKNIIKKNKYKDKISKISSTSYISDGDFWDN